jgi:hypothetical protein
MNNRRAILVDVDMRDDDNIPVYTHGNFSRKMTLRGKIVDELKPVIPFSNRIYVDDPSTVTDIIMSYQNTVTDLRGIEEFTSLETFEIIGAMADFTSLAKCKNLKKVICYDSCLINDIEAFMYHPSIEEINLEGKLTNYNYERIIDLLKGFKNIKYLNVGDFLTIKNDKTYKESVMYKGEFTKSSSLKNQKKSEAKI